MSLPVLFLPGMPLVAALIALCVALRYGSDPLLRFVAGIVALIAGEERSARAREVLRLTRREAPGLEPGPSGKIEHVSERPWLCPENHWLGPGLVTVGWMPCDCPPAMEAGKQGKGRGHMWWKCRACEDEGRQTFIHDPPHVG